jgi:tripartite-type tricarboxylate transporter receptor subunit TctC
MPGNPSVVAEFMPGAGGRRAADYLYTVAPKDGTVLGLLFHVTAATSLLRPEGTRYDPLKFNWLGSQAPTIVAVYVWHAAPATTHEGLREKELVFGTQAKASTGYMLAHALNAIAGTKFKLVTGYSGTGEYLKAIESGEIHAALADWDSIISARPDWVANRTIVPLYQFGIDRHATLPNVPRLVDLATTDDDRAIAELEGLSEAIGHTNVAPPDVPADRVAALKKAIAATYADPEFRKAAEKIKMDVSPVSAETVEAYVKRIMATNPALIAKARVAFGLVE